MGVGAAHLSRSLSRVTCGKEPVELCVPVLVRKQLRSSVGLYPRGLGLEEEPVPPEGQADAKEHVNPDGWFGDPVLPAVPQGCGAESEHRELVGDQGGCPVRYYQRGQGVKLDKE